MIWPTPIKKVYPDFSSGGYGAYDYQPLLESWGYKILLQLSDDDYSGDSYLLFKGEFEFGGHSNQYGLLVFGWGSCTGCDALRRCETLEEVEALRTKLADEIRWDSPENLHKYMKTHDWEGDWTYHRTTGRAFVAAATILLDPDGQD
jgi:hypothetical protein